ncbi:hypothetical protein SMD44_07940 [Streptomyces alboflavus]|uniref:Uncharacterized protein n=1 Tax=Streptomyces alboflavus TaxID=67267 RepID=A0A1Z1WPV3_9ACTN|nr:hypothetical protein SMD44_07940 [Streptomyces alboflavus]
MDAAAVVRQRGEVRRSAPSVITWKVSRLRFCSAGPEDCLAACAEIRDTDRVSSRSFHSGISSSGTPASLRACRVSSITSRLPAAAGIVAGVLRQLRQRGVRVP